MLVLKRNHGEGVHLSGGIRVVLLPGNRIGIDAPRDVKILRDELVPDANGIAPQQLDELWIDHGCPVG